MDLSPFISFLCFSSTASSEDNKEAVYALMDKIDFEHGGTTYLIGLGTYDGSVFIIKLDGSGDIVGYAYSRVTVDYTGSASALRTMNGFGAG